MRKPLVALDICAGTEHEGGHAENLALVVRRRKPVERLREASWVRHGTEDGDGRLLRNPEPFGNQESDHVAVDVDLSC